MLMIKVNAISCGSHGRCYTPCAMGVASQTGTPDTQLFRDVFNTSSIGIAVENLEGQPLFLNLPFAQC